MDSKRGFAKLFDTKRFGQICVISGNDNDESAPEIRLYFKPEDMGICSQAIIFGDTVNGYKNRDRAFKLMDEETAERLIEKVYTGFFDLEEKSA